MKKTLFLSILSLIIISCSSSDDDTPIDNGPQKNEQYPVHLTLDTKVGGMDAAVGYKDRQKAITEPRTETDKLGYKGIILYSDKDNNIHAYDLACPNCWNGNVLEKTNDPTSNYECKVCGLSGYAKSGLGSLPSQKENIIPFVKYQTTKTGTYTFKVSNPKK